jgi:hypothetical protein
MTGSRQFAILLGVLGLFSAPSNASETPLEVIQACKQVEQLSAVLYAMKRLGVGYEEGLLRLRRRGNESGRPRRSWEESLWKEAFSKRWQSGSEFREVVRDFCLAGWQRMIETRPEEEAERQRRERELDKVRRDDFSAKSIRATGADKAGGDGDRILRV